MIEYFYFATVDLGNAHQAAADVTKRETRSIMCLLMEGHSITCELLMTKIRPQFDQASRCDYQHQKEKKTRRMH